MYTAAATYGTDPPPQPTNTTVSDHAPGTEASASVRTQARYEDGNPVLVLVGIIGIALALLGIVRVRVNA